MILWTQNGASHSTGRRDELMTLMQMKVDQDTLERRLWAKQEKVKAEHERQIKAEKDMCAVSLSLIRSV